MEIKSSNFYKFSAVLKLYTAWNPLLVEVIRQPRVGLIFFISHHMENLYAHNKTEDHILSAKMSQGKNGFHLNSTTFGEKSSKPVTPSEKTSIFFPLWIMS